MAYIKFIILIVLIPAHIFANGWIEDKLTREEWRLYFRNNFHCKSQSLVFKNNGTFQTTTYGVSGDIVEGTYEVEYGMGEELLILTYKSYSLHNDHDQGEEKKETLVLVYDDINNVRYNNYFKGKKFNIASSNDQVPENRKMDYNGVNIVTITNRIGKTTSNLRMRSEPSINSDYLMFKQSMEPTLPYIPMGYTVRIIARTEKRMKIQDWNNYWYLIDISSYVQDGPASEDLYWVWVYGEFVHGL
ncbi:MAG: hypothetical protein GY756_12905 [bacterium]|nr:hypothetical protein [bacterium]